MRCEQRRRRRRRWWRWKRSRKRRRRRRRRRRQRDCHRAKGVGRVSDRSYMIHYNVLLMCC